MVWLRIATRLVLVQLTMVSLSLLGLGLLGIAPAATAAARVVGPVRRDEALPVVRTMWETWRTSLLRSHLAAAPAGLLAAAAAGNLLLLGAGALDGAGALGGMVTTASGLVLVLACLTWMITVTLAADPDLSAAEALRAGVLFPLVFPGTGLSLLVTLGGVALVGALVTAVAVLVGGAAAMLCAEALVSARRRLLSERLAPV